MEEDTDSPESSLTHLITNSMMSRARPPIESYNNEPEPPNIVTNDNDNSMSLPYGHNRQADTNVEVNNVIITWTDLINIFYIFYGAINIVYGLF